MKTITGLLLVLGIIITTSCEGPQGPPGIPGEDGLDAEIGTVFETNSINFTAENEYSYLFQFPSDFTVYDGDVVLVYILWNVSDGTDIWRLLPQTVVLDDGVIQYNYDHTLNDVQIFLEWTVGELLADETDNQIFRVAVLPADLVAKDKSIDVTDFESVMKSMNKNFNSIEKIAPSLQTK